MGPRSCQSLCLSETPNNYSVNLDDNAFHCFDARCGKQGDIIDLWAELHRLSLRAAAVELVQTFDLEPAPPAATEKMQR